jgi:5-formyltetrahydrofolate cyclo-ligase
MVGYLPETDHDFRIDFAVTPNEIISTHRESGRPKGIMREHLTEQKILEILILGEILSSG